MKHILPLIVFVLFTFYTIGQNTVITDDASYNSGEASAMLDVKSTSKGLMIPRVELSSTSDVLTISSPATGLLVYDKGTNIDAGFYYWNGSAWTKLTTGTPASYIASDGTTALSASWDIGDGNILQTDGVHARDAAGLQLYDDGNNGLFIEDGGDIGLKNSTPDFDLDITGDLRIESSNKLYFGGTGSSDNDVNLYRSATNVLKTDDALNIGDNLIMNSNYISRTGNDEGLFVTTNGYVGVRTSNSYSPTYPFHIELSTDRNPTPTRGIHIESTGSTSENHGLFGWAQATGSEDNYGVWGRADKDGAGTTSGQNTGVYGSAASSTVANYGVYGSTQGTGQDNYGSRGDSKGTNANAGGWNVGVYGWGEGATGNGARNIGVHGEGADAAPSSGYTIGVSGRSQIDDNTNFGMYGGGYGGGTSTNYGVKGHSYGGTTGYGLYGEATNATTNYAVYATASTGTAYSFYGAAGNFYNDNNVGIGTSSYGTNSDKVLAIGNGTAPTGSITDGIILYAEDATTSELKVRDEAGNVTTLSPHNFSLIKKSEPMAWSFYCENDKVGQRINVDLLKTVRLVEQISGEKLVHLEDLRSGEQINNFKEDGEIQNLQNQINELKTLVLQQNKEIKKLKKQINKK